MRYVLNLAIAAALITALPAAAAAAKPALRDIPEIDGPLFGIVVAYVISEECPTIAARKLKGLFKLEGLYNKARSMGYSHDEIKAYVKSPTEKERMRKQGMVLLKTYGPADDPQSYCAFGRAEIEKNSAIGALLRAK